MSRGLSSSQLTAAAADHRENIPCLELLFDSGTLRLAAGPFDIEDGDDVYIHTGALLQVGNSKEDPSGKQGLEFTMSGLDPAIIAIANSEPHRGRVIRLRKARLNVTATARQLIGTTTIEWVGRIRSMVTEEQNNRCQVMVSAEHYEIALTRAAPRRWNDADQQRDFAGDRCCEYAPTMIEKFLPFPAKEALRK